MSIELQKPLSSRLLLIATFPFLGLLTACSTNYENTAIKSWDLMARRNSKEVLALYEKNVTDKKEELLRLMDEGMVLRVSGDFKLSNEKFLKAADIIEDRGYVSLSEQGLTLLTNEKQQVYQGEDFEKILIHVYLALNFLELNELESALVETRRVNQILYQMISTGKRPYELNAFARYLGACIYERKGELNDAAIDYRNTLKIDASLVSRFPQIQKDILKTLIRLNFDQELQEFKKQFGEKAFEEARESVLQKRGSVIILFENGKSPQKYSSREKRVATGKDGSLTDVVLPIAHYKKREARIRKIKASISESGRASVQVASVQSAELNDIEATAIQHLNDRMGRQVAKALASAAIKTGIAVGVAKATDSEALGWLTALALIATSQADTRSWLLLPAHLQVARIDLPPGKYKMHLEFLDQFGGSVEAEDLEEIQLKPNEIKFIQRRSFD